MRLFFQGDICIEEVEDAVVSGTPLPAAADGAIVLAEGEFSGHRHAIADPGVVFFSDWERAGGVPAELYIGHLKIPESGASLVHEEHDTITLPPGTYRIRRQREFDDRMARIAFDFRGRIVSD